MRGKKKDDRAMELVNKMENEGGVMVDSHSYNVLLDAYLKATDWVGFDGVVKRMMDKGLE